MLPRLQTDRISRSDERLRHRAVVITTETRGTRQIVAISLAAERAGVRVGMTLAQARAAIPTLADFPHDPAADTREREAIATILGRVTPIVHIYDSLTIALDLTGCERAHGGFEILAKRAAAAIAERGYELRCALAPGPTAARALAMVTNSFSVNFNIKAIPPGGELQTLGPLRPELLQINPEAVSRLDSLGITTILQLAHLPRSAVAARVGPSVLLQLDRALSAVPEPLDPFRAAEIPIERIEPPAPVDRYDIVLFILKKLADGIGAQLESRGLGARSLVCSVERPDSAAEIFTINLSSPRRAGSWLFSLLKTRFERIDLGRQIVAIELRAAGTELLKFGEPALFDDGEPAARQDLRALVDRLCARLGEENVNSVQLLEDHRPEYRYQWVRVSVDPPANTKNPPDAPAPAEPACEQSARPLQLYKSPRPVEIEYSQDGSPARVRSLQFIWRDVVRGAGPEYIQSGWWDGRSVERVYWIIELDDGGRFWIFHDPAREKAFVHGEFV